MPSSRRPTSQLWYLTPEGPFEGSARQLELHSIRLGCTLQCLFSTFPDGWPGFGLLLLRLCLGIALVYFEIAGLSGKSSQPITLAQDLIAGAGGICLLAGLWTPGYRGRGALVFQWFRQHGSGFAAQKTRHSQTHCHGTDRAHLCGATVSYAAELGYEVTVAKDATASYSDEHMHASLEVNLPNYASAIVTTDEIVGSIAPHAGVKVGWEVEMRSTPEVVPDHLKCFAEQDIDGTLSDCSGDAVFVSAEERSAGSVPYEPYLKNCLAVRQTRFGNYVGSKRLVEGDYA